MSQSKTPAIDLVAEARAVPVKPPGDPCSVVLATQARPEMAATIIALVHDDKSPAKVAAAIFAKHDIYIPALTIGRHRRGLPCAHCTFHGIAP